MAEPPDAWYIRLPDGHVLRAATTAAVRHHLESGTIPVESHVRRSPEDAWAVLERMREFADLVPTRARPPVPTRRQPAPDTDATRPAAPGNGLQLQAVGVRGCVDELLAALDGALARRRLLGATAVGVAGALMLFLAGRLRLGGEWWSLLPWVGAGVVALSLYALYAAVVTQMLFVELSQLRPATPQEIAAGLVRNWLRLLVAVSLVGGLLVLLITGLAWLERSLHPQNPTEVFDLLAGLATSLRLVLEVLAWPVGGLAFLLAPIVVIEERSALRALGQWGALLRANLSRGFVYEALAAALGTVTSLPLLFPVALAAWAYSGATLLNPVVEGTLAVLWGLAVAPLLAYLAVANVHIFLNLRYERL